MFKILRKTVELIDFEVKLPIYIHLEDDDNMVHSYLKYDGNCLIEVEWGLHDVKLFHYNNVNYIQESRLNYIITEEEFEEQFTEALKIFSK